MELDQAKLKAETRRPVLARWAQERGIEVNPGDNVTTIKEKLTMASFKSAPAAPKAPVAAPKAPVAPPKAAAPKAPVAAPKAPAAPAKAAAPAPKTPAAPKAPVAAPKAAAAAPKGPQTVAVPKALAANPITREEFDSLVARIAALEVIAAGYGQGVTVDAEGVPHIDPAVADDETLLNWAYQFNVSGWDGDPAALRASMIKTMKAKNFAGWGEVVNQLPRPEPEAAPEAAAEGEDEGEEITEEQIDKANWSTLTELADRINVDYSDITKPTQQPKVLRTRIKEALAAMGAAQEEIAAEDGATEGAEGEVELQEGTPLWVNTGDPDMRGATFVGVDADGDYLIQWTELTAEDEPPQVAIAAAEFSSIVQLAEQA